MQSGAPGDRIHTLLHGDPNFDLVVVGTHGRTGLVRVEILELLEDRPCDLVVMGSHGRTGIRRALLGSVGETVVRHAACPVLVARKRS